MPNDTFDKIFKLFNQILFFEEPTFFFIELINKSIFCLRLLIFAFVIIRSGR